MVSLMKWILPSAVGAAIAALLTVDAGAVPSFARKYRTSCQTCHTQYPRLTPFGEAFRLSGYQYPEGDEDAQKGKPVSLGSERYADLFPDSVWPGEIMASVPLSLRAQMALRTSLSTGTDADVDFQVPANIAINVAGTLAEDIALWTGVHVTASGEVMPEKVVFVFSNLFEFAGAPRHLINLRVGQFEPEAQPFSSHRLTTITAPPFSHFRLINWAAQKATPGAAPATGGVHAHLTAAKADASHGGEPAETPAPTTGTTGTTGGGLSQIKGGAPLFGLERGLELYGIIASRLLYGIGVVNGNGAGSPIGESFDVNAGKDITGRLQYKIGGMAFDGTGDVDEKNWREYSAAIGTFARWGESSLTGVEGDGTARAWESEHLRVGGDLDVRLSDVQLVLAAAYLREEDPIGLGHEESALAFYSEVYVVWMPWLQSSLRYNGVAAGHDYELAAHEAAASLGFLIRPNVKAIVEASLDLLETDHFPGTNSAVLIGLDGAF